MYVTASLFSSGTFWICIGIALVLSTIAGWKMLAKAGENPWKILIPFYGTYQIYKIACCEGAFWGMMVVSAISSAISTAVANNIAKNTLFFDKPDTTSLMIISIIELIIILLLHIYFVRQLSSSFGKGGGFAAGLFFLYPVFALILGFDSSEYGSKAGLDSLESSREIWICSNCGCENPQSKVTCQSCGSQR